MSRELGWAPLACPFAKGHCRPRPGRLIWEVEADAKVVKTLGQAFNRALNLCALDALALGPNQPRFGLPMKRLAPLIQARHTGLFTAAPPKPDDEVD